jgi:hypothetical protein
MVIYRTHHFRRGGAGYVEEFCLMKYNTMKLAGTQPENGDDIFLQNTGPLSTDYMVLYSIRQNFS